MGRGEREKKNKTIGINGVIRGVEGGEYTFMRGRENTVIDYVMEDEGVRKKIESMRIGKDHRLLEVREKGEKERRKKEKRDGSNGKRRGIWSEEGCKKF